MELRGKISQKQQLSPLLRGWLPILQANIQELNKLISEDGEENPLIEIHSGFEKPLYSNLLFHENRDNNFQKEFIDNKKSLFKELLLQIEPPIFPTPKSRKIALKILDDIEKDGFFSGNISEIAEDLNLNFDEVEKIRQRFSMIEPVGVGAKNWKEALIFQLNRLDLEENFFQFTKRMILKFENLESFSKEPFFQKSLKLIRTFKMPPAIDYLDDTPEIVPDIIIQNNNGFKIFTNDSYYPVIEIKENYLNREDPLLKKSFQDAKHIISSLKMRKATLKKIGLMLLEYQYEFFNGGSIKPLTLQILADEFGHNISTISRAISDKYLLCDRGLFPLKNFFSRELEGGISNDEVKDAISYIVSKENREKPLTDLEILKILNHEFSEFAENSQLKLVRRTVTKYRNELGIERANKRRFIYSLKG